MTGTPISPPDALLARIRGEYREMPGLRLTRAQACRVWHLDRPSVDAVIRVLVDEGFLAALADGAFIALPERSRTGDITVPTCTRRSA
jgi:hypothetical protein